MPIPRRFNCNQIKRILLLFYQEGATIKAISKFFQADFRTIKAILTRKSYKDCWDLSFLGFQDEIGLLDKFQEVSETNIKLYGRGKPSPDVELLENRLRQEQIKGKIK